MHSIGKDSIGVQLPMADGSRIVVLDMLAAPSSVSDEVIERNVYRVSPTGQIQWRINVPAGVYARTPFTGIHVDQSGRIVGYRWDGTSFIINVTTGDALPFQLSK